MSAEIPSTMQLDDLLKPTGYNCPSALQGKTFDEAISGDAELEDNKEVNITSNGDIEITPTEGKEGMKKVTAHIAVESSITVYAWNCADTRHPQDTVYNYFNVSSAPADAAGLMSMSGNFESGMRVEAAVYEGDTYTKISDTSFSISWEEGQDTVTQTYTRDATKDFTLWVTD